MLQLTLKNLRANKVRFALTTFGVTLAVSFVVSAFVLGDGLRCASGSLLRFNPAQNTGAGGTITLGPGIVQHSCTTFGGAGCISASQTWNFQVWFRDNQGPCATGFSTSNAVTVTFVP